MRYVFLLCAFSYGVLMGAGCTKKQDNWIEVENPMVTDTIVTRAENRILTYKVINGGPGNIIYCNVNDTAGSITVYLPHYAEYQFLETEITLPAGATISPAASELVPVFTNTPFTYTVKDKNGKTRIYTVKTVIQQPALWLKELSGATSTLTLNTAGTITIAGTNMVPSYEVTKLNVIDKSGKTVYQLGASSSIPYSYSMAFLWTGNVTTALVADTDYWFQITSYGLTYTMQYPFRVRR